MSYNEDIDAAIADVLNLENDNTFHFVVDQHGTQLSEKVMEGSSINCLRYSRLINLEPDAAAALLWGWEHKDWLVVSPDLVTWEKDQIDADTRLVYQVNKVPWPLQSREVVVVAKKFEKDGTHYLVYKSVESPKFPKSNKYVRAKAVRSAFIFKKENGQTRVIRFMQIEPGGVIPSGIVNSISRGMIDKVMSFLNNPVSK